MLHELLFEIAYICGCAVFCAGCRMETVASKVPFYQFALLLDKISAQSGTERKKQFLRDFIDEWRAFHNRLHNSATTVRISVADL